MGIFRKVKRLVAWRKRTIVVAIILILVVTVAYNSNTCLDNVSCFKFNLVVFVATAVACVQHLGKSSEHI
jgi:hypothetical protein